MPSDRRTSLKCLRCERKGHKVRDCKILRRRKGQHLAVEAGSSGSEPSGSQMLTPPPPLKQNILDPNEPMALANRYLKDRWEEVHFIMRGYQEVPCKTRKQNPKYYNATFICEYFDHHSHRFCKH